MSTCKVKAMRLVSLGWQATYACGCNSGRVNRKRDMALRCAKHGDAVRTILHDVWTPNRNGEAGK